jgi:RNA polymerase sigma-70 factor (ECF subfamily)
MPSDDPYVQLVEPHRAALRAYCRRMLGSPDDAEDALQDTLVRAWKGLPGFEGRGSLRGWLYRIATNVCLQAVARRSNRRDRSYATFEIRDNGPGPDARYEQRESLELAFAAARRLLPQTQRTVLVLREVLGYSAAETADVLDRSVPSVNSALQRARRTLESRVPERDRLDVALLVRH